jgi:hypothetical protein
LISLQIQQFQSEPLVNSESVVVQHFVTNLTGLADFMPMSSLDGICRLSSNSKIKSKTLYTIKTNPVMSIFLSVLAPKLPVGRTAARVASPADKD